MVEFAILLPIFMLLMFGLIEFGRAYNNQEALRSGVREAARQGAVGNFGPAYTTGSPCYLTGASGASDDIKDLMCLAKTQIGLDATKVRVKVLSGSSDFTSTGTFSQSDSIIVCAQFPLSPVDGWLSPFIGGQVIKTKTSMRIEKSDLTETAGEETAPSGSDWSWCTVSSSAP